jgi:Protein of unknown function (DUF1501)
LRIEIEKKRHLRSSIFHPLSSCGRELVNGRLGNPGELDYYSIEVSRGEELAFEVLAKPAGEAPAFKFINSGFDARLALYEPAGSWFEPHRLVSLSTLLEDLKKRGLLESTLVIAMGEFDRTPDHNANAGRDHWPQCWSLALGGGGIRGGRSSAQATNGDRKSPGASRQLAIFLLPSTKLSESTGRRSI